LLPSIVKRQAKERASILRKCDALEKLLDTLPPDPVYRLIREVLPMVRATANPEANAK
jgi:hypothetical protein